jgi:hypothetical protein
VDFSADKKQKSKKKIRKNESKKKRVCFLVRYLIIYKRTSFATGKLGMDVTPPQPP